MLKKLMLAAALVAAPAFADTVAIDTYTGPANAPANPQKVAVFDVAAIDTLNALGVQPAGAVENLYVTYLDDVTKNAAAVGNLFEPDFEAVAALAPDLIIAGGRSSKVVPDLARIAPTIDMTMGQDTVGNGLARLDAYGEIFGKQAEAAALAEAFNEKLTATKAAAADQGKALIVMTNGPKVSAYGASGRFGWLHKTIGLSEAVAAVEQATHGEAISFEFIAEANPDILIVVDRLAAMGAKAKAPKPHLITLWCRARTRGKMAR